MEITIQQLEARPVACVRVHTDMEHISEVFDENLTKVASRVAEVGGTITGPPFTRYLAAGSRGVDMEVGFPTLTLIPEDGDVAPTELPEVEAAVAVHEGAYDGLPAAYAELQAWIAQHGRRPGDGMWEVYLTDPGAEPSPEAWRTQIVWPLRP